MKITHRPEANIDDLKKFVETTDFEVEYEIQASSEEIKAAMKTYKGPPIGFAPPEGWIEIVENSK